MKSIIITFSICFCALHSMAQFDPAGGEIGSLAVHHTSGSIMGWADSISVKRGWMEAEDTLLGLVTHGSPTYALGESDNQTISLGDGGEAILFFKNGIQDRKGYDFAIFENGFEGLEAYFLELAFVEVSVDGIQFTRFPSESKVQVLNQVGGFSETDPEQYSQLAGKHQAGYGTPFDLSVLEMDTVFYIKIIDVVGKLDTIYGSKDAKGNIINDPYPTPWESGGFDLDAVAIIDQTVSVSEINQPKTKATVYESGSLFQETSLYKYVFNPIGVLVEEGVEIKLNQTGIFTVIIENNGSRIIQKILVI